MPNGDGIKWPWKPREVRGNVPWTTPAGVGFRAPWTEEMYAPWGEVTAPTQEGMAGFSPEMYLQMLYQYLAPQLGGTKAEQATANAIGQQAVDMLNAGQFGPTLPQFTDIFTSYSKYVGQVQKLAPEEPEWYDPEKEERLRYLPLEKFDVAGEETPSWFQQQQVERWGRQEEQARIQVELEQERWEQELTWSKERDTRIQSLERQLYEAQQGAALAGPVNWIQQWGLQYGQKHRKLGEQISGLETAATELKKPVMADIRAGMPMEAGLGPMSMGAESRMEQEALAAYEEALEKGEKKYAGIEASLEKLRERKHQLREERLPPTPSWLSQFTGLSPGQPITRQQVKTPSPQTWGQMPWQEREGLKGYAQWATPETGKPWIGTLEEMERMRPTTPRGVGYKRWQPARQR